MLLFNVILMAATATRHLKLHEAGTLDTCISGLQAHDDEDTNIKGVEWISEPFLKNSKNLGLECIEEQTKIEVMFENDAAKWSEGILSQWRT